MSGIRVRFAPSPTGHLHIGGARTALFNWLYARKTGGKFILRIEDTDKERSTKEAHDAIIDAMQWLGLDWDEGPETGGDYGPYLQSARSAFYRSEIEALLEAGKAYQCFCTSQELDELREEALKSGQQPKYDGRCRLLPADEIESRLERGTPHVIRFKMPDGETKFWDVVRGEFSFQNSDLDDFVIQKSDGLATYNFAVVVDDAKMEISHVIRGDDHLSNTPKQVCVYHALGYKLPKFAHLPMILGSDRSRLSKRHGATSVQEYRNMGYSPDGLLNYLALLGWSLDGETEYFSRASLIDKFSLKRVSKNPGAFDKDKLNHIDGEHFKKLEPSEKLTQVHARLSEDGVLPADFEVSALENVEHNSELPRLSSIISAMGNRLDGLARASDLLRYFFKDDYKKDVAAYEKHIGDDAARARLERLASVLSGLEAFDHADIEAAVRGLAEELGVKAGELIHPCRVALTGMSVSPDIFAVVQLVGKAKSIERLHAAATS